jgi:histidinol-phosphatase
MPSYADELEVAIEAARRGAEVAHRSFGKKPAAKLKPDGSWVTEADVRAEDEIRSVISSRFPGHNILGEEGGLRSASGGGPVAGAPTWFVDPIDGTNNYLAGIPVWATLVGLRRDGDGVVGACHAPALGELYDGARGEGARWNGAPMTVDPLARLDEATFFFASGAVFTADPLREAFRSLTAACRRSRGFGDFWGHMLVARGAGHVMLEPDLNVWDVAALQPIIAEAGGRLTQLDGSPWVDGGSCLTTNGVLHDEVVSLAAACSSL